MQEGLIGHSADCSTVARSGGWTVANLVAHHHHHQRSDRIGRVALPPTYLRDLNPEELLL